MKNTQAFTLIELLVVVLIIGILTAVALPQYQISVVKSRYASLKNLTQHIAQAEEIYYLKNNTYTTDFSELDIDMPAGRKQNSTNSEYKYDWGGCILEIANSAQQVVCISSLANMRYQQRLAYSPYAPNARICRADSTNLSSIQAKICIQETKRTTPNWGGENASYFGWTYRE